MTPKAKDIDDAETYALRQSMADQIVEMAREEGWWFIAMAYHDGTQRVWNMKKPTSRPAKIHLDQQITVIRQRVRAGVGSWLATVINDTPRWMRWFMGRGMWD